MLRLTTNDLIQAIFFMGLALLATHELDAMTRHEWRLLPVLSQLSDESGRFWFVLLHIPVFGLMFWLTGHRNPRIRVTAQRITSGFLVAHGGIHFALSGHALYEFEAPIETVTVYGGAACGLLHLLMAFRERSQNAA